jgi:hypothetical protein
MTHKSRKKQEISCSKAGCSVADPGTATKERGENNFFVIPFTKFTKLNIILVLKC